MTNFKPMKDYLCFLFDILNSKYHFKSPFLDAGAGIGDFSLYLGKKGFSGDAVDISKEALKIARKNLKKYPIKVILKDVIKIKKKYKTIVAFDVVEHIEKDYYFIKKLSEKLATESYIILTTPNNPKEWSWDDEFYGHVRRYTPERIKQILKENRIELMCLWDFTFPFFWMMRRISLKLLKPRKTTLSKLELTKKSTLNQYWSTGLFSRIINDFPLWPCLFWIQFLFRKAGIGHEIIIVGRKK